MEAAYLLIRKHTSIKVAYANKHSLHLKITPNQAHTSTANMSGVPNTQKAAFLDEYKKPVVVREREVPKPSGDEVSAVDPDPIVAQPTDLLFDMLRSSSKSQQPQSIRWTGKFRLADSLFQSRQFWAATQQAKLLPLAQT